MGKMKISLENAQIPMGRPSLLINCIVKKKHFLSENNQLLIKNKTFIACFITKKANLQEKGYLSL